MSGAQITAFNFNQGFGLPFTVFTPVYWGPQNTRGVNTPTSSGSFQGVQSYGTGITPELLASAQANLAGIGYTGLNTISYSGMNSQALIGSLFQNWGNTLGQIAQQNANTFQEAVDKSNNAKASGLLGGIGGILKGVASFFL